MKCKVPVSFYTYHGNRVIRAQMGIIATVFRKENVR